MIDELPRVGAVLLASDLTTEADFSHLFSADQVHLHYSRVQNTNPTTPENLIRMTPLLTAATDLLVPGTKLAAIYYSCTSAAAVIGEAAVQKTIQAARPKVPVVTPTLAVRRAFAALGLTKIALLAPYLPETCAVLANYLRQHGLEIHCSTCLGIADDRDIARVPPASLISAALPLLDSNAEALFLPCTALPALAIIDQLERLSGKPVVTSNQASAWVLRHHAQLNSPLLGFGKLMRCVPGSQPSHYCQTSQRAVSSGIV